MVKEEPIIRDAKIKYRGVFDLGVLYKSISRWYVSMGYKAPEENEVKYSEKVRPDGKQIEIVWETSKSEEADYFKIVQSLGFYITRLTEAEIEQNGNKVKLDKADLELSFNSKLVMNADKKKQWNEHSIMFKIYERFIIKHREEELKIDTYKDTNRIMDEVKNFLNLYRF